MNQSTKLHVSNYLFIPNKHISLANSTSSTTIIIIICQGIDATFYG